MAAAPTRRSIIGKKPATFPRWRAALDHPFTKTAVIVFQVCALSVAAGGAWLASQNLVGAERVNAYQLISNPVAPINAKWRAAATIVERDGSIQSFRPGCEEAPTLVILPPITCGSVFGMTITGGYFFARLSFIGIVSPSVTFDHNVFRNVSFDGGDLSHTNFFHSTLDNVGFSSLNLTNMELRNTRTETLTFRDEATEPLKGFVDGPPPRISIFASDASGAIFADEDLSGLRISDSNISGTDFADGPVTLPIGYRNYFLAHHPPTVDGEAAPQLANYVCSDSGGFIQLPELTPDCYALQGAVAHERPPPFDWLQAAD